MATKTKRFQFIWWGDEWYIGFIGPIEIWYIGFTRFSPDKTDLSYVYDWSLCIGPIEIRKWTKRKLKCF